MMKVVALKIFDKQNQLLRALVNAGLYSSISEPLRQSGWELLRFITQPLENSNEIKNIPGSNEFEAQFKNNKTVSVSGKFPLKLIELIDWIVAGTNNYDNRSHFFRSALSSFLGIDSQLFTPYILSK